MQAVGAGAATTKDAHAFTGAKPGEVNHAQFVIVEPTIAVSGIVKLISKYLHWPGANAVVLVAVTIPAVNVAFSPADIVPSVTPESAVGTVSVTVNEVIVVVPVLQMYT